MSDESFFLVWNPSGNSPRRRHDFEHEATREAERLAVENPGCEFYVLQATRHCKATQVVTTELKVQLPF
ncbi:hypothetical protein ACQR5W_11835 [Xanthomonas sacchari]